MMTPGRNIASYICMRAHAKLCLVQRLLHVVDVEVHQRGDGSRGHSLGAAHRKRSHSGSSCPTTITPFCNSFVVPPLDVVMHRCLPRGCPHTARCWNRALETMRPSPPSLPPRHCQWARCHGCGLSLPRPPLSQCNQESHRPHSRCKA